MDVGGLEEGVALGALIREPAHDQFAEAVDALVAGPSSVVRESGRAGDRCGEFGGDVGDSDAAENPERVLGVRA